MIKHIVMWNYKDGFSETENAENAKKVKLALEALLDLEGVNEMKVHINNLPSSNMDMMLESLFEDELSLHAYKIHPGHLKAVEFIQEVLENRVVFDWEV